MRIACIIILFLATFVSRSTALNNCTVKVEMETEYGPLIRSFTEWQITDDLCPLLLLVTGGVSRFRFACSDGVASRVEMFTEDSFHDETNAPTIIASDSWTHRINVGSGSPSVVFERSLDAKQLNHFTFEMKAERPFTICGFKVYSQDDCSEAEAPTNGHVTSIDREGPHLKVTYGCNEGFKLRGLAHQFCHGTHWHGHKPTCFPIGPRPPHRQTKTGGVKNGVKFIKSKIAKRSTTDRSKIGAKDQQSPGDENVLSCGLPGRPVNGLINGSKFEGSESFPAGTEVQFSCVESHQILEGAAVRTCTEDGTWSGLRPWCDTNIAFGMQATISNSNGTTRSAPSVTDGKTIDQNGGCSLLQRDSYLQLDAAPKQFCAVQRILIQFQNLIAKAEHSLTVDGHSCQFKRQMDSAVEYECTSPNHGYDATAVKCANSLQFKNLGRDVLEICEIEVYQNPAGFECGEPEFPANGGGLVSLKGESYFVDYKCNEGYHLVGDSRRTCHGRHWQGKQPVCIPVQFQSAAPRSSKSITKRITSDSTSVPLRSSTTATEATEGAESAILFLWIGSGLCLLLVLVAVVVLSVIYRIYWKRKKYVHDYESIDHGKFIPPLNGSCQSKI